MSLEREVLAARAGAGLFELEDRGLIQVEGGDARRWLNGMLSNDVALLAEGPQHSGCRALLLTNKGRVVADLQVLLTRHGFWLETLRSVVAELVARLSKFVIADDVRLVDRSTDFVRFGLEGPGSGAALAGVLGAPVSLASDACAEIQLCGVDAVVARFGWSGEDAFQLFVPPGGAAPLRARLVAEAGVVACTPQALEVLRIEAGRPRLFAELSQEVLPPEARLEAAISYTKGCYTGQEIVARLRSRGHVNHLLVGLAFEAGVPPEPGAVVRAGEVAIGEITSAARSPHAGAIALAFVRVGHDAPGTLLDVGGAAARVVALPVVAPSEVPR